MKCHFYPYIYINLNRAHIIDLIMVVDNLVLQLNATSCKVMGHQVWAEACTPPQWSNHMKRKLEGKFGKEINE